LCERTFFARDKKGKSLAWVVQRWPDPALAGART
jgi:hypothetical protein